MSDQTFDIYHLPMIKKGDQFWNNDKTQGYEFVCDYDGSCPLSSHHISPLGEARKPVIGDTIPQWFGLAMETKMRVTGK